MYVAFVRALAKRLEDGASTVEGTILFLHRGTEAHGRHVGSLTAKEDEAHALATVLVTFGAQQTTLREALGVDQACSDRAGNALPPRRGGEPA